MSLNKFTTALEIYREEGFYSLINKSAKYTLLNSLVSPYLASIVSPRTYQQIIGRVRLGYWPNIQNPRTFNEHIINRKVFSDNDIFSTVEDKWAVREYVSERISDSVLPKIYHVTTEPDTIPFESLPENYVIKPTHLSGPVILVDAGDNLDPEDIKSQCYKWLDRTYGQLKGEYWYSGIKPRIIVEERLHDDKRGTPLDFKFFVFHGRVKYIQVDFGRFSEHRRRFYDREWTPQEFRLKYPLGPTIEEPAKLDEMIEMAEILGEDFAFMRVDLYHLNNEEVVFGEMTVAPGSGGEQFIPREFDFKLGALWEGSDV